MLAGFLGRRTFLDPDIEEWHLDVWRVLIERFGDDLALVDTPVALPTRDFFPPSDETGHGKALHVFDCVRALMRMPPEDWPCRLEAQPRRLDGERVAEFVAITGGTEPNGTFRMEEGGAVITYASDLVDEPVSLVATFAHEMAHYLLASESDLVADETHELMTDLVVAFAGLGVFGANTAFSFEQHSDAFSQGWRSRSSGYFSSRSWAFALAVFAELRGDDGGMGAFLKPELERLRRQAVKYLRKQPQLITSLSPAAVRMEGAATV